MQGRARGRTFGAVAATLLMVCAWRAPANAQTFSTIHVFEGQPGGREPTGLVADSSGALYVPTIFGGHDGKGAIFQLRPPSGNGPWESRLLHSFIGGGDGARPYSAPTIDSAGNIYGATAAGTYGRGVVYRLAPPATAGGAWTSKSIYQVPTGPGAAPEVSVVPGDALFCFQQRTLCQLLPSAKKWQKWTLDTLATTANMNAGEITAPPVPDGAGGYLSAATDEQTGRVVVFRLVPPASPGESWRARSYFTFPRPASSTNAPFGEFQHGPIVRGQNGSVFGTTIDGGVTTSDAVFGCGIVFQVKPPAAAGQKPTATVLHSFQCGADGQQPMGLISDAAGNLFGVTEYGGATTGRCSSSAASGCGTIYELSPPKSGDSWTYTVLHRFQAGRDGKFPTHLILGPDGALYGVTENGGSTAGACRKAYGCGTVFRLALP